jgi:peptidoglycan LD-endopeptidase LytH
MYKDNGLTEWSFDPYPHLRQWERKDRIKSRKS